ncbi:MAG: hypothetical protein HKN01_12245, partial [Acidimicrobiia bacterium]|nr:hypothetical protein [Acidimicrobiia bacterium]
MDLRRAPIGYLDIRRDYQTMRFLASASIAVTTLVAMAFGMWWASIITFVAAVLAVDAWRRRTNGDSAEPTVYLDMTLIALGLLISGSAHEGHSHAAQAAGTAAVITAAILILPMARSAVVMVYAAFTNALVLVIGPRLDFTDPTLADELAYIEQLITVILLVTTAVILYGAA